MKNQPQVRKTGNLKSPIPQQSKKRLSPWARETIDQVRYIERHGTAEQVVQTHGFIGALSRQAATVKQQEGGREARTSRLIPLLTMDELGDMDAHDMETLAERRRRLTEPDSARFRAVPLTLSQIALLQSACGRVTKLEFFELLLSIASSNQLSQMRSSTSILLHSLQGPANLRVELLIASDALTSDEMEQLRITPKILQERRELVVAELRRRGSAERSIKLAEGAN